jgi:alkaline phosphatase
VRPWIGPVLLALAACHGPPGELAGDPGGDGDGFGPPRPRVILFVGDGMGPVQEEVASRFATGAPGALEMHRFPVRGQVQTASATGLTDSAASATAMATGVVTYNGRIAIDRDGEPHQTLIERARELGLATGVVTTTTLTHATPASFTAHETSRGRTREIAADQIREVQAEVMLGGGASHYAGEPDLFPEIDAAGYRVVADAAELETATTTHLAATRRLFGAFAGGNLPYVKERADSATIPDLEAMTLAALAVLDADPDGFFLMVEGGRIDHAGHGNRLEDIIHETLELDRAIAAARAGAAPRQHVTILVTADHETGGLEIVRPAAAGELPEVSWLWGSHTNRRVSLYGQGRGLDDLDGALVDHRWIHAALLAAITETAPEPPPRVAVATGHLGELRHLAATQSIESDLGDGGGLDALRLDADRYALTIGVEGTFGDDAAALILVDADFGAATGAAALVAADPDGDGDGVNALLYRLAVDGSSIAGFGADFAAVSVGGAIASTAKPLGPAGWRAIDESGLPLPTERPAIAINYDDGIRDGEARPLSGLEIQIPWSRIFPDGAIPAGATIAVAAVLASADGAFLSNQALAPLAAPGELGAVAVIALDRDGEPASVTLEPPPE